jgi:hypothetical protein
MNNWFGVDESTTGYFLLLLGLLGGCDFLSPSFSDGVHVLTDSAYVLKDRSGVAELRVQYVLQNQGEKTVYVEPNCLGEVDHRLERWDGGSWSRVTSFTPRYFADCGPGERMAIDPDDNVPRELVESSDDHDDLEGTYRMVIERVHESSGRDTGVAASIASERFSIRW